MVLHAPSWWNLRHTLWVLGGTVAVLLLVMAWIVVLGRRLREQMELIRQKIRSGGVLQERNRIARELHDNLEQELAGITMQLDLAVDCFQQAPRVAQEALETARNMSRHSMLDARRSVWDLRCHLLEEGDLVSALRQTVQPAASHDHVNVDVSVTGAPVRLPASVEMNLLRIGQEAVANAIRHGGARSVKAVLQYDENKVRLSVTDDGQGFRPQDTTPSGHFGLLDMRERAHSMGSVLQVESEPQRGTRVAVEIPVKEQVTR
jgi:signal transduction histidine kinase